MTKALIVVHEFGVEEPELLQPVRDLKQGGVDVTVVSDTGDTIQTVTGDKDWASTFPPDAALDDVDGDDYDVLVLPGGTVNADTIRGSEKLQALLQSFASAGKPVAAICHAPWTLIDADLTKGKTMTSYSSVRVDLENAGANWVDEEVKRCPADGWVLITSRTPDDLDAFTRAILDEVAA